MSLNIARVVGDTPAESRASRNLVDTKKSMRYFPKAIKCYEKSFHIVWVVGDLRNTKDCTFKSAILLNALPRVCFMFDLSRRTHCHLQVV